VDERRHDPPARGADGVSERDRTAPLLSEIAGDLPFTV